MKNTVTSLALVLAAFAAQAQSTPAGLWKTIDDETKTEKSLVRISEAGGVFSGRIEKLLDPAKQTSTCDKCEGERKGKPIAGMTIIEGVKKTEGKDNQWDGGHILDPNNGKTYKVRLTPVDDNKKLEVRGYIGAPLLGRTQTWLRVE